MSRSRIASLDGLRAVAVTAVVLLHVLVASSTGLEPFITERHAGQEWVIVFFVLSGLVLSIGAAEGARFDPARYYPARLMRLYLPVWASLVLAAAIHETVDHDHVAGATGWLAEHAAGWSASATWHEATLVFGAGDYYYSTVLWSLRAEVLFSLMLPLYLACAVRLPPLVVVGGTVIGMLALVGISLLAFYMLTFMLGVALAFHHDAARAAVESRGVHALTLVASPVLLTAIWWMPDGRFDDLALPLAAVGAVGLVTLALVGGPAARLLEARPLQAVGKRSFSVYLVHEPILVAAAFALGGRPSAILLFACAIPPVVAIAMLFYRYVEWPSHRAARRTGGVVSLRFGRTRPAPQPAPP